MVFVVVPYVTVYVYVPGAIRWGSCYGSIGKGQS